MANPKNPVRAARQAKRQAVSAARTTRKVAKIEAKAATKVAKITAKTPGAQPKQASKSAPTTSSKSTPKTGMTGKDLLTYNVKPKAPAAKGPSYAPFKTPADQKKSQQMTADDKRRKAQAATRQQEAAKKKAAADEAARKKKAAADAKKKQEAAARKKQEAADAAAAEEQRKKDMFLQPGETRENTIPYPFTQKAKLDEARETLRKSIEKWGTIFSDGAGGNSKSFEPKSPGYGQRKKGGAVKKSMYNKRK